MFRNQIKHFSSCLIHITYLSITILLIFREVYSILAKGQIILFHPLTGILSPLSSDLHHPCGASKVHLKPLITVFMFCTPGSNSRASPAQMKSASVWAVITVPAGGGPQLCRANAAISHSKRFVTSDAYRKEQILIEN